MTRNPNDELLHRVQTIRVALRHGRPSPHKPLLLLLSIGRHLNGQQGQITYGEIEGDLNGLIRRFGLPDSRENAHYPFWHLTNDRLWELDRPDLVRTTTSGDPYLSDLRGHDIRGGLTQDFVYALDSNPDFSWRVVGNLLSTYFPPSLHQNILESAGLVGRVGPSWPVDTTPRQDARDPRFRQAVLQAYMSRCALCELDVQVAGQPIGIEAAHIKWHCAKGPARVDNGMALCVLHHKFFDAGLFTVLTDFTVLVGGLASGDSVEESLNKYGGSVLQVIPERSDQRPATRFLRWHEQAVFKA